MISFLKPTISFLKKAFLVVAVYFIVINLFSHFIGKDKVALSPSKIDPIKQNRAEIYKVINDKELNKTKEGKLTIALYKMSMCSMIGEACTNNPSDADKNYSKSVFGFMSNLIIIPYANPPASGVMWAYEGLQNAGFVPKTMAAEGIGFAAIKPFANLWKIFRDISYMLLVIVLIAIGFMIMFRAKINPQTVISVENALPKIIISLILITFSFAIAGFLIDLMYIMIGLIVSILINDPNKAAQATLFKNEYMMARGIDLFREIKARSPPGVIETALGNAFTQIIPLEMNLLLRGVGGFIFIFLFKWLALHLTEIISGIAGLAHIQVASFSPGSFFQKLIQLSLNIPFLVLIGFIGFIIVVPTVVSLLVSFSILFMFFRIFFLLFTSYLKLIINIIIAPLLLLFEAVPGKSAFKYWFMNIVGNLLPFPVIIFVSLLAYLIIFNTNAANMTARLPYLYGIDSDSFRIMIGLGMIFLIPDFIKTIKEALGIKELPFNIGVGTFFGGVAAGVGGGVGLMSQFGSLALAMQYIPGGRKIMEKLKMIKPEPGGGG